MGKVSIALRGWRFDEDEVFDADGELRPLDELSEDTRERLIRLTVVAGSPCDACWLIHGDANIEQCNVARVVYGEPLHEVVLCADHEPDFLYWFRDAGGSELANRPSEFEDAFYEWFGDDNRAPEDYGGMEHVDTDPDSVPRPQPDMDMPSLEEELERLDDEELDALGVDLSELDIDRGDGGDSGDEFDDDLGDLDV
ncbi:hypothetical protein [Halorarius litoreus]|uniref:hypothetical protein n=1 Tax=Halorarius litoreus TaxID=2962676 RepID=UPI0020CCABA6|nr:hypothetical protein [Halorarius litoreus]